MASCDFLHIVSNRPRPGPFILTRHRRAQLELSSTLEPNSSRVSDQAVFSSDKIPVAREWYGR
jgi:hypothetical protein